MRKSCVVMAEGQQTLLRSMKNLLEPHLEVAAMTDNVLSLIDSIQSLDPDVAIIHAVDLHRSRRASIEHFGRRFPDLNIIIVGDIDDPEIIRGVITRNVKGYVHLQDASTQLISAVHVVLEGHTFVPPSKGIGEDEHAEPHESAGS